MWHNAPCNLHASFGFFSASYSSPACNFCLVDNSPHSSSFWNCKHESAQSSLSKVVQLPTKLIAALLAAVLHPVSAALCHEKHQANCWSFLPFSFRGWHSSCWLGDTLNSLTSSMAPPRCETMHRSASTVALMIGAMSVLQISLHMHEAAAPPFDDAWLVLAPRCSAFGRLLYV